MRSRSTRAFAVSMAIAVLVQISAAGAVFNEIRIQQTGTDTDEYVEFAGSPDEPLDGLTMLVLGDGSGGSGVIEEVVPLTGGALTPLGFFLMAESSMTLAPSAVTLTTNLTFENNDNLTFLLVSDFSGAKGDDLDADDDGVLDATPWSGVADLVALIKEENPPSSTEYHYGPPAVGPDGGEVVFHAYRYPDATGAWLIGLQDAAAGADTPGDPNRCPVSVAGFAKDGAEDAPIAFSDADFTDHYEELRETPLAAIAIVSLPAHGTLSLGGSEVTPNQQIDAADLGQVVYTPDADWHGADAFEWAGGNGVVFSGAAAAVTLNVAAANDPPVAYGDEYSGLGGATLVVPVEQGVLVNDADVDGDALTAQKASDPSGGTVTVHADGSFDYVPDPGFSGQDSFTYTAHDGSAASEEATVTISVVAVSRGDEGDESGCAPRAGAMPDASPLTSWLAALAAACVALRAPRPRARES